MFRNMYLLSGFLVLFGLTQFISCISLKSKCCDNVIGCFTNEAPFQDFPLPDCPVEIGFQMKFFTRNKPSGDESELTRVNIPESWSPDKLTVFIVHGFRENCKKTWLFEMKDKLLEKDDLNVVIVGWGGGAEIWNYALAASNVRTVGAEIAVIVNHMSQFTSLKPYCIGFSLGAHVCGHAGMRAGLSRITGLDPAGPFFEDKDPSIGLNPECADFVDVIHTHGVGKLSVILNLGTLKPLGHVDFYPNRGFWQPGCYFDAYNLPSDPSWNDDAPYGFLPPYLSPACSHQRAHALFSETITNVGDDACSARFSCEDSQNLPGSCTENSTHYQEMGYHSDKYDGRGIYYLSTTKSKPFCDTE